MVSVITGSISLIGTVLTIFATNKKTEETIRIQQAVMSEQINALKYEVREHNNFAKRVPLLEKIVEEIPAIKEQTEHIPVIKEQIKVINLRLDDLEDEKQ